MSKVQAITGSLLVVVLLFLIFLTAEREYRANEEIEKREIVWLEKEARWNEALKDLEGANKPLREIAEDPYRGRTLTLENKLVLQEYVPNDKHAIVTMVGFPSTWHPYWMGALGMIQSLRESQTRVPHIVVMIRDGSAMPKMAEDAFERLGVELLHIENFDLEEMGVDIPGTWANAFDKLHVWSLTQFEKVLFLDADTLIVQNIDHLFMRPELTAPITPRGCNCRTDYVNGPEFFSVSSGFFICEPSLQTFQEIIELASGPSPDPDDLEQFGGTWHWGDQEMIHVKFDQLSDNWHRLNWQYDVPAGTCNCETKRGAPVYSYHFVCSYPIPKPWYDPFKPMYHPVEEGAKLPDDCAVEIFNLWFRMFAKAMNYHELNETFVIGDINAPDGNDGIGAQIDIGVNWN